MTASARRSLAVLGLALAAAAVFSPTAAAIVCGDQDHTTLANAFALAARPMVRSLAMAAVAAGVALLLGVPFALAVERSATRLRRALWAFGLLTLIVPPYIVAESAIVVLGPAGKLSRGAALLLGFGPSSADALARARYVVPSVVFTWPAAGSLLGGCFFAIVALAVAAAYRRTDSRVFEAARLAQGRRGVLVVATRLLLPAAIGAGLLVFAVSLTESVAPQLLRVRTVGDAIYECVQAGETGTAAALGIALVPIIVLAGVAGAIILLRTRTASLAGLEGDVPKFDSASGGGSGNNFRAIALACIAVTPALVLPALSLTWLAVAAKLPPAVSGTHRVLRASGFVDALRGAWELTSGDAMRTVAWATITATIATVAATLIAWPLARSRWNAAVGIMGAGLAVPAPIVGLGLIALWNRDGIAGVIYQGPAIVVLGWLARFFPVAALLVQAALTRVPRPLEEAAALAGRGAAAKLGSVVLPAAAPGLASAWIATYVLSAGEFTATLLVSPPGKPMLAPSVVNLMRRGQDPQIAACQVLLLTVIAAPLAFLAIMSLARLAWKAGRR